MPNHVQNLITFTGDVSAMVDKKVSVYDVGTLSLKLGILLVASGDVKWQSMLDVTEYHKVVDEIDNGFKELDEKDIVEFLARAKEHSVEVAYSILHSRSDEDRMSILNKPTSTVSVDWSSIESIMPCPLGVEVNGFNASFYKAFPLPCLEKFPSGYTWNHRNLGTKWGAYEFFYEDEKLLFNTAWSTLSEEASLALVKKVHYLTGEEPVMFYCAEQGCAYYGEGQFFVDTHSRTDWSFDIEYSDMEVWYVHEDDKDDVDLPEGYERCDTEESYYSPGGELPEALELLEPYGWGG